MKSSQASLSKLKFSLLIATAITTFSCSSFENAKRELDIIDPQTGMTREQFEKNLLPEKREVEARSKQRNLEPSIPDISNILTAPPRVEDALPDKLISLSITQDVPLKDVLIEISRLADVDMEIDPEIDGGIILRVTDRPFKSVIDRICKLGGLRYNVEDGIIRVEKDNPYQVDYKVNFLNMKRDSTSTTTIDTQSLASSAGEDSGSSTSGSNSTITLETEGDMWESTKTALTNILMFTEKSKLYSNAPAQEAETAAADAESILQMNQQAGVISVIGTERQHQHVERYLKKVAKMASAQVLIEAKVVEVILDKEYRSGINWDTLNDHNFAVQVSGNFDGGITDTTNIFTISASSGKKDLSSAVNFTERFGVTKTLSSPRINAMHNQQAVLSFTRNEVYFELEVTEESVDDGSGDEINTANVTSEIKTIPIGVILNLQPSINLDKKEITMHVRPTLSTTVGDGVRDPAVDIIIARQLGDAEGDDIPPNIIPVVETREIDSILKIKDGDIMVIGGLMKNEISNTDTGVPYASRVPVLGNLFKGKSRVETVTETVIFIKATIIDSGDDEILKDDKRIYNNFWKDNDTRPLAF